MVEETKNKLSKKLLVLSNSKGYGGADKSLETLLEEAVKHFRLKVIAEHDSHYQQLVSISNEYSETSDVTQMEISNSPLNILKNVLDLKDIIENYEPDMILVNSNRAAIYLALCALLSKLNNAKVFLFIRGFDWKFTKLIFAALKNSIKLIPTQAVAEKENYVCEENNKEEFKVLNNPIKLIEQPSPKAKRQDEQYILCLANTSRWKGLEHLIDGYSRLSSGEKSAVKLKIFGSVFPNQQEHYEELQLMINGRLLQGRVEFCEFTSDTAEIFNNSLFLVNTSISEYGGPETFGRTIPEAWGFKKPVISFDCGGPRYIVDDGVNGFLVEEKNTKLLSKKMSELIDNPKLREEMGEAGYKKVKECFSPKKITEDFKQIVLSATPSSHSFESMNSQS